jgi:hypothetical protein
VHLRHVAVSTPLSDPILAHIQFLILIAFSDSFPSLVLASLRF